MKLEIRVAEATALFKEIQDSPEKLFEMIRSDKKWQKILAKSHFVLF